LRDDPGGTLAATMRAPTARRQTMLAAIAALAPSAGCQAPSADVLAVWIDAAIDTNGARAIQIYDAGERRNVELRPTIPGSDIGQTTLGVPPGGGGFVAWSVLGGTVWVDLVRGTRGRIGLGPWGELAEDFAFSRSGRAVLRMLASDAEPGVVLMPIATRDTTPLWLRGPAPEHEGAGGMVRSASDAPVVYWAEVATPGGVGIDRIDGTLAAYRYPSEVDRDPRSGLVPLGQTRMHTRAIDGSSFPGRIGRRSGWCSAGFCVTPDGDAAIGVAPDLCQLYRWRPALHGSDGSSRPPREIDLPLGCGVLTEPHLLAALDAGHVLLDDEERLYLADLDAGLWTAMPKLGIGQDTVMLAADGGRVMNLVAASGALMRADVDGLQVVSAERAACASVGPPLTSPGGGWVLMTCRGGDAAVDLGASLGTVLRISALGLERFDGLAMRGLGIDDGGNALLYSYDPDDNEAVPRGMFVLEASGTLARVDELEPTPEGFASLTTLSYFSAASR